MLMIWSSRPRNRSLDPVVSCFFGRMLPPLRRRNHSCRFEGIPEMKLQASEASNLKNLRSQIAGSAENRLSLRVLRVVHDRLKSKNSAQVSKRILELNREGGHFDRPGGFPFPL